MEVENYHNNNAILKEKLVYIKIKLIQLWISF